MVVGQSAVWQDTIWFLSCQWAMVVVGRAAVRQDTSELSVWMGWCALLRLRLRWWVVYRCLGVVTESAACPMACLLDAHTALGIKPMGSQAVAAYLCYG